MQKDEKNSARKIYRSPRLTTYGAIQQITQAVGLMKMKDGASYMGVALRSGI